MEGAGNPHVLSHPPCFTCQGQRKPYGGREGWGDRPSFLGTAQDVWEICHYCAPVPRPHLAALLDLEGEGAPAQAASLGCDLYKFNVFWPVLPQQRQTLISFSTVKAELWNKLSQKPHCEALQRLLRCFSHVKWGSAETRFFSLSSAVEACGHSNHKRNQKLCCTQRQCVFCLSVPNCPTWQYWPPLGTRSATGTL